MRAMYLLRDKRVFIGGLLGCLLMVLLYSIYVYFNQQQSTLAEIYSLFDEVIHVDKEYRSKEVGLSSSSGYNFVANDNITISYADGHVETITKDESFSDLSVEERNYRVDQSFLVYENPISVAVLDSLFQAALQQKKINVHAALAYTLHKDTTVYSNPDSSFYQSSYDLLSISTGAKEEIVLHAYIKNLFPYVFSKNIEHFSLLLLIMLCLTVAILLILKYGMNIGTTIQEEPRKLLKIKDNLLFDKGKGVLYFSTKTQVSLKNYRLKLFVLLLDSPEHFQTSEEIKNIVWKDLVVSPETLYTTIKRLRDDLKPIPDLKIKRETGGYRLCIL